MANSMKLNTEPTIKIHRYVVVVTRGRNTRFRYCMDREAVRELKRKTKPGAIFSVYAARHEFKQISFL